MRPGNRFGRGALLAGLLVLGAHAACAKGAAATSPVVSLVFHGLRYATCTIDPASQELRLYWDAAPSGVLGDFTALQKQVAAEGGHLLFAANAGMFDPASKPVGLLVLNGVEKSPLNLADGAGNFYMKPNGIFALTAKRHALVIESSEYPALVAPPLWATQSGPLLVHGGDINPDFLPDSKNRKIRSGVGVTEKGEVILALSRQPVTFYEFAELFSERLRCPNALYLDGEISDFWKPGDVETDGQHHFGPMFGLVAPAPHEGVTAAPAAP
jgi:uncharacterized protein YigE (DUF2233 family)